MAGATTTVEFQSNVKGYRRGDIVELPTATAWLDDVLEGGFAVKMTKSDVAEAGGEAAVQPEREPVEGVPAENTSTDPETPEGRRATGARKRSS